MSNAPENPVPVATPEPPKAKPQTAPPKLDKLPQFKVLLHNDDVNDAEYVAMTLVEVTPLRPQVAMSVMIEAHTSGVALVLTTHREAAELYAERLVSKGLTATIEADR